VHDDGDDPTWSDRRRPLTPREQGLVDVLVAATRLTGLRRQAADLRVSGECRCGCSSVRLESSGEPVATDDLVRAGSQDGYHLEVGAAAGRGRSACQVVLHVVEGRLHELEVFREEGAAVALPEPRHLRVLGVGP